MQEITELMDHYRNVSRSLWNAGFWSVQELQNWDSHDLFEEIRKLLFNALVVAQLEKGDVCCNALDAAGHIYQVIPSFSGPVPIMIQQPREGDRSKYWDDPVREVRASDVELHFLDYFDWNQMGYVDFQYYRVRIAAFASQPHLVGREALLEHRYARVFTADTQGTGDAG